MNFQERKRAILELLELRNSIGVAEFARKLKVSEITVRRDLNLLTDRGLIYRTHGGAMNIKLAHDPVNFASKAATNAKAKEYIARIASSFASDGDVIFMDCGSTVYAMHEFLKGKSVTVITNSLPLANAFIKSNISVNLIGGELDGERMAMHGSMAVTHINFYKAMKAFVGADGVSIKGGLSSRSEKEAEVTRAMISKSDRTFLLCDSSKLEQDQYLSFAPLNVVDTVVTDRNAPASVLNKYRNAGIKTVNSLKK